MTRFTRGMLEVDETDDKVQLTTFKAGLKSRDFVASLAKNPLKTMVEALLKAQKYMNAEEARRPWTERTRPRRTIGKTTEGGRKETELISGTTRAVKGGKKGTSSREVHTTSDARRSDPNRDKGRAVSQMAQAPLVAARRA